jgi:hypothetical protein
MVHFVQDPKYKFKTISYRCSYFFAKMIFSLEK